MRRAVTVRQYDGNGDDDYGAHGDNGGAGDGGGGYHLVAISI